MCIVRNFIGGLLWMGKDLLVFCLFFIAHLEQVLVSFL